MTDDTEKEVEETKEENQQEEKISEVSTTSALMQAFNVKNEQGKVISPKELKELQKAPKRKPKRKQQLLPPINPIRIAKPGSSKEVLTQAKLKAFYELQAEYYELQDKYVAKYRELQRMVIKGAAVAPGKYGLDPSDVIYTRHPRYKQALIEATSEKHQLRVLDKTQPHASLRVRVRR